MTYAFDPEIAGVVAMMPDNDFTDLPGARKRMKAVLAEMFGETDTRGVTVRDELIAGPDGAPDIRLRVYLPDRRTGAAAILDVHGGAYTIGDLDTNHVNNLGLARDLGVVVVAVDYRLAPEAPFPAGLDDCYAALCWMAAHTGELGVDPSRIAIRGESAGGGLFAALALRARDRGGPAIAFQFLAIPQLDDRLETASMRAGRSIAHWREINLFQYRAGDDPAGVAGRGLQTR